MQFESKCAGANILMWGQRRNLSPITTLWPCSHTQCLTHSNHLLILLWTDLLVLTHVLWWAF